MVAIAQAAFAPHAVVIGRRPAPMDEDLLAAVAAGNALVADEGDVVGYATLAKAGNAVELRTVAVVPERQGQGIGRALIGAAEKEARRRGADRLTLYTNALMTANRALYRRYGFRETDEREVDGFRRVFFEKPLGPRIATKAAVPKLYGRRRGQGHRDAAGYGTFALELGVRPADVRALFDVPVEAVRLEVGFGGGEHLVASALAAPTVGHIGAEPFESGVMKTVRALERHGIANVRLHMGDARDVLVGVPPASLDRIDVLYPDPWHKQKHRKRRFISMDGLSLLARALVPGGTVRFASDIEGYVAWTRRHVAVHPAFALVDDSAQPWDGWSGTRYEAKALREGRVPRYLTFERRAADR